MEVISKCIYCDTTKDLSKSDIIPDALTNSKIYNKNVCRIEHNNKFSDMFESEVIHELAFITNELDIKSKKGKDYPQYNATVKIDNILYNAKKIKSDNQLFKGGSVLESIDKKYKFGPIDTLKNIVKDESEITIIDLNSIEIEKSVSINPSIFFSESMYRLVSKIAYEWYCAKNNIIGKNIIFDNIISYITAGEGVNPVSIITESSLYQDFNQICTHGSHSILAYLSNNSIFVTVNLFGIVLYNVKILDKLAIENYKTCLYQELLTDGSKIEIYEDSVQSLVNNIGAILDSCVRTDHDDFFFMVAPPQFSDKNMDIKLQLVSIYKKLEDSNTIQEPNNEVIELVIKNTESLLQASSVHKKSLKRFVNENFKTDDVSFEIRPNNNNNKTSFLFYVIYLIGKSGNEILNQNIVNSLIKSGLNIFDSEFVLTDETSERLRSIVLVDPNYQEVLIKGVKLIKSWE